MAPPAPTQEKPKAPTIEDLMALIKAQGEQIEALKAKTAQVAEAGPAPRAKPSVTLPAGPPWSIRVRAVRQGFYPDPVRGPDGAIARGITHKRRFGRSDSHPGDEFVIEKPEDFAAAPQGWMELATAPATKAIDVPPTTAVKPVQDPLMAGVLPTMATPQRTIES